MTARARSQVSWKTAFRVCIAVVLTGALVGFLYLTRYAITVTLVSILVAVALDHGCAALQRRGVRRGLAVATVVFALLGAIGGIGRLLVLSVITQARQLSQQMPELREKLRHSPLLMQTLRYNLSGAETEGDQPRQKAETSNQANAKAGGKENGNTELVAGAAKPISKAVGGAVSLAGALVTVLFLSVFMLVFGGRLVIRLLDETIPDRRERYERVLQKIYTSVGGYIVGLLFICLCNATLTTTFLALSHTPFFLPLGIVSGFSSLIPYAGPVVVGASISGLSLATSGITKALITAGYFVAYGQLEGNVLAPLVFRRTAHVNPLMTLLSVLFFAELGGVPGAILAVPVMAAAQIVIYELLSVRRERLQLPHPEHPTDPLSSEPPPPGERPRDLHA